MNKGVIYGLVIIFTAVGVAAGWFGHLHLYSDVEKEPDTKEVAMLKADLKRLRQEVEGSLPKLWIDKNAAATFKQFGYDHVDFIRWQNAVIDGWVEFDTADGPKRFPLDGSRLAADQWAKDGHKVLGTGTGGNILIGLRKTGKSDEYDCEVKGDFAMAGAQTLFSEKGKVKREADPKFKGGFGFTTYWDSSEVNLNWHADKKGGPWVHVKLVELPK